MLEPDSQRPMTDGKENPRSRPGGRPIGRARDLSPRLLPTETDYAADLVRPADTRLINRRQSLFDRCLAGSSPNHGWGQIAPTERRAPEM